MDKKIDKLRKIMTGLRRVVVAYSGGLDSTFLLKTAVDTLGRENVIAVTARSETYPVSEYREAVKIAKSIGARQMTIDTEELKIKNFNANPVNRCYYCKRELFKRLNEIKGKYGFTCVLDGTNYDDLKDVRYGRRAARELKIKSPLLAAKFTKADIRRYSRSLRLSTWDKPSFACLASRFPFDSRITREGLRKIDAAEAYLRGLGFKQVRVRVHKDIARLELLEEDLDRAVKMRRAITGRLRKLGFVYVTLDLAGYRTGSMHEAV